MSGYVDLQTKDPTQSIIHHLEPVVDSKSQVTVNRVQAMNSKVPAMDNKVQVVDSEVQAMDNKALAKPDNLRVTVKVRELANRQGMVKINNGQGNGHP
jgi:hypothetical protein